MSTSEQAEAGALADKLIATEVAIQDRMWGDANERADATGNQLVDAAFAQLHVFDAKVCEGKTPEEAVAEALPYYPEGWDGLRDYGSPVANLVVVAAFIRSEIKRRVLLGEDTTRTKRGEPYKTATPYVSSEEAAREVA